MRTILYTGKGGVGKTSVAAATALLASKMGYRTAIMSTDPAHSLGDSFDKELGPEPRPVAPNLWGQEVDVLRELQAYWRTIQEWLAALMRWQGMDEVTAEELAVFPGMEELAALLYITHYHDAGEYDLLVVDCAPTAETIRLLSFPDMARWYMHRLFPIERRVASAIGPLARGVLRMPVPGKEVHDSIQFLFEQLEKMRNILLDGSQSSVRLVVNPEKMVIKEAQRTLTYLNLYGYHTDLVVCNRVLPEEVGDSFFDNWKESQARHLQQIHQSFDPIPIFKAPLMDREVVGLETLEQFGRAIFDEQDPTQVFYQGQSQEIVKEGRTYSLKVKLPFTSQEQVSVLENPDELIIQVGHYRRSIFLPRLLAGRSVKEAILDKDVLTVRFHEERRPREEAPQAREG